MRREVDDQCEATGLLLDRHRAVDESPLLLNPVQDSLDLHPAVGLRAWLALGTTILFDSTRDASGAAPGVWKLPDRWTQRTRPPVFAKRPTVSHSSHTPHRHRRFQKTDEAQNPSEALVTEPQILRRRPLSKEG